MEGQSGGEQNTNFNPGGVQLGGWLQQLARSSKGGVHEQLEMSANFSIKIPLNK